MRKLSKHLILALALTICAGVVFFPLTAYAVEGEVDIAATISEPDDGLDISVDAEDVDLESVSGIDTGELPDSIDLSSLLGMILSGGLSFDTDSPAKENLTPDGTGTVMDNVFIYGNDLEFFTFTTEAGNVFYLVIDRSRTKDNVYFLNAVTEQDLVALAEKAGTTLTGTSGIPPVPGTTTTPDPTDDPETPEEPPAEKSGMNSGTLIFILIGVAAVGGVAFYVKIIRPKQQKAMDDDDAADYGDGDDEDYDDDDYDDGESSGNEE